MNLTGIKTKFVEIMPAIVIQTLARPYVAGFSLEEALNTSKNIFKKKILSTIDLLGEDAHTEDDVKSVIKLYGDIVEGIANEPTYEEKKPTISLKPSAFVVSKIENNSLKCDSNLLKENMKFIIEKAQKKKIDITIDMEDHHWTELTLKIYKEFLEEGFKNVGTVLQTRLFRTEKDIEELPKGGRIRLCIGIYREPKEIAYTDKDIMKERLLQFSKKLFQKDCFVEFATHDVKYLERFFSEVVKPEKILPNQFEIQMLYGVPRKEIQEKILSGFYTDNNPINVRLYIPFAVHKNDATAYCRRRLIENPDIIGYGVNNIIGRFFKGNITDK